MFSRQSLPQLLGNVTSKLHRHRFLQKTRNCPWLSAARSTEPRFPPPCPVISLSFLFHFSFLTTSGFHQVSFPEHPAHFLLCFSFPFWPRLTIKSLSFLPSQSAVHFSEFRERSWSYTCLAQTQAPLIPQCPSQLPYLPGMDLQGSVNVVCAAGR